MAPVEPDHNAVERQLKDVIQILYETMIQVYNYDAHTAPALNNGSNTPLRTPNNTTTSTPANPPTRDVLAAQLTQLSASLQAVHTLAASAAASTSLLPDIPRELITYVDGGRNPDIYTREFVELVRRENQLMRGKMRAFASFRDVLARELASANPELCADVERVVTATGGEWPPPKANESQQQQR